MLVGRGLFTAHAEFETTPKSAHRVSDGQAAAQALLRTRRTCSPTVAAQRAYPLYATSSSGLAYQLDSCYLWGWRGMTPLGGRRWPSGSLLFLLDAGPAATFHKLDHRAAQNTGRVTDPP